MTGYQYAALNPISNVDINGDSVDVSRIGKNTMSRLASDASSLAGLTISDNNGTLAYAKDPETGQPIIATESDGKGGTRQVGSALLRKALLSAIGGEGWVMATEDPAKNTVASAGGTNLNLNIAQINDNIAGSHNVDSRTMGYLMSFMHEWLHTGPGGGSSDGLQAVGVPGPTEDKMNSMRAELNQRGMNFGQRSSYSAISGGYKEAYIPFDAATLKVLQNYAPGPSNKYIVIDPRLRKP